MPKELSARFEFPRMIYDMLEDVSHDPQLSAIISWMPHGKAFKVHIPSEFETKVMPNYFIERYNSFKYLLEQWGFHRLSRGMDRGAYYNLNFVRGQREKIENATKEFMLEVMPEYLSPRDEPIFYKLADESRSMISEQKPKAPQSSKWKETTHEGKSSDKSRASRSKESSDGESSRKRKYEGYSSGETGRKLRSDSSAKPSKSEETNLSQEGNQIMEDAYFQPSKHSSKVERMSLSCPERNPTKSDSRVKDENEEVVIESPEKNDSTFEISRVPMMGEHGINSTIRGSNIITGGVMVPSRESTDKKSGPDSAIKQPGGSVCSDTDDSETPPKTERERLLASVQLCRYYLPPLMHRTNTG